jgi:hypothetical protein
LTILLGYFQQEREEYNRQAASETEAARLERERSEVAREAIKEAALTFRNAVADLNMVLAPTGLKVDLRRDAGTPSYSRLICSVDNGGRRRTSAFSTVVFHGVGVVDYDVRWGAGGSQPKRSVTFQKFAPAVCRAWLVNLLAAYKREADEGYGKGHTEPVD